MLVYIKKVKSQFTYLGEVNFISISLILQHFQADNAESDVIRNFASGIEKTFQEIATFAVPGPGSKVTDGSDGESLKVDSKLSRIHSK